MKKGERLKLPREGCEAGRERMQYGILNWIRAAKKS